jgi:TonB family protein
VPEPPKEKLKIRLTDEFVEMVQEDSLSSWSAVDTTDLNLPPIPIYKVPVYPPAGRTASDLDTVTVRAIITKRGNVKRAWIVSSTNNYFNKATLKAVVQWRFQPALRHGVPVDTLMTLPIGLNVSGLD